MKIRLLIFIFLTFNFSFNSFTQNNSKEVSVLFYNVENLFDIIDNPETEDNNFTPGGELHWTSKRLNEKILNISKVILSASGWNPPVVVGLCEIENRYVLENLIDDTPLKSIQYKIIHKESPDHRGIDVALLYDSEKIYPLEYQYFPLRNAKDEIINTREILYFSGIFNEMDTIHFFVNHWPSRYSGLLETREQREIAAQALSAKVKDLFKKHRYRKVIILGDFNDNPSDESIAELLAAKAIEEPIISDDIYNLSFNWEKKETGTLKYQAQWFYFDQIMVSGSLLKTDSGYTTCAQNASIIQYPYLLEKDEKYGGQKPKRTYYGYSYNGGFSDHLPVLLKLEIVD